MTRTKAKRLIDELIAKYGDVVVAKTYDYWLNQTYVEDENEQRSTIIAEVHLSEVEPQAGRSMFEELADIVMGKAEIKYIPIEVAESKAIYDTPQQAEYRRIAEKNRQHRFKRYAQYLPYTFIPPTMFVPDWYKH
jgi:signal peptidase I